VRLETEIRQRFIVLPTQVAVDFQEPGEQFAAAAGIDLIDDFVEKPVVDVQLAEAEFLREDLEPETAGGFLPRRVAYENAGHTVGDQIVRVGEQRQPLAGGAGLRKAAEHTASASHARFSPVSAGSENGHLRSALIDV